LPRQLIQQSDKARKEQFSDIVATKSPFFAGDAGAALPFAKNACWKISGECRATA